MRMYATLADYQDSETPPTEDQIRRASLAVDEALIGAIYEVDADGMPTDTVLLQATKDACMAQVAALAAAETSPTLTAASIGSASYSFAAKIPDGLTLPAGGGLCADAARFLQIAGLSPVGVITYG